MLAPLALEKMLKANQCAGGLLRKAGFVFEKWKDYDWIKETTKDEGYADYYLMRCWNDSKKINKAEASVYRQLVEIDSVLGTTAYNQLCACLSWTTRWNIIQV